ncbi:hypothetical protein [Rhizobium ruizarguesonis]|uniref:hypothetical protein n=1 Tax=Rhizobium ruizarguesonis TaxID=2081791 RepID=UPI00103096FC|nr:hypothetical protein [Rhizobium ruizarguesonis]TBA63764.1 hypothetical protein ELH57_08715 [Rhizobium ruizarguesonis]TBY90636.1 hypothetical protein E0H40_13830 [Rhizobium leguminosarum bv. viciae]
MTISLQVPSEATSETFSRAMEALGAHPDQPRNQRAFRYLPPFRKLVLSRIAAQGAELAAAAPVGWQYFISDSLGAAVIDLSDKILDTFSSVRRGAFAERYENVLKSIEADRGAAAANYRAEVLEMPQIGTCAVMARESYDVWFYPVCLNGKISELSFLSEHAFFASVPKPQRSPDNESGNEPSGPVI